MKIRNSGIHKGRRPDERKAPLRKVVGRVEVATIIDGKPVRKEGEFVGGWNMIRLIPGYEKYECGHIAPAKQDIIGTYYAKRRRCAQCQGGKDWNKDGEVQMIEYDEEAEKKYPRFEKERV